jgi:hypothetical protein
LLDDQAVVEEGNAIGAKVVAIGGINGRERGSRPRGAWRREGEVG